MSPLVDTDPIPAERALTAHGAATIATGLTVEQIEELVMNLSAAEVPLLLRRLDQATTLIGVAKKVATIRMLEMNRLGEKWTSPEGEEFTFEQTKRGEFDDLPGLFYVLSRMGASVSDLARTATGARVTELEALAMRLPDDVRADALETVKQHRVWKEGNPRLEPVVNAYRRPNRSSKKKEEAA